MTGWAEEICTARCTEICHTTTKMPQREFSHPAVNPLSRRPTLFSQSDAAYGPHRLVDTLNGFW